MGSAGIVFLTDWVYQMVSLLVKAELGKVCDGVQSGKRDSCSYKDKSIPTASFSPKERRLTDAHILSSVLSLLRRLECSCNRNVNGGRFVSPLKSSTPQQETRMARLSMVYFLFQICSRLEQCDVFQYQRVYCCGAPASVRAFH